MIKRILYFGNPAYLNKNESIFSKVSGSNVNFGKDIDFEVSDSEIEKTSKVLTL